MTLELSKELTNITRMAFSPGAESESEERGSGQGQGTEMMAPPDHRPLQSRPPENEMRTKSYRSGGKSSRFVTSLEIYLSLKGLACPDQLCRHIHDQCTLWHLAESDMAVCSSGA